MPYEGLDCKGGGKGFLKKFFGNEVSLKRASVAPRWKGEKGKRKENEKNDVKTHGVHSLLGAAVVRRDSVRPVGEHAGAGLGQEREEGDERAGKGEAEHGRGC